MTSTNYKSYCSAFCWVVGFFLFALFPSCLVKKERPSQLYSIDLVAEEAIRIEIPNGGLGFSRFDYGYEKGMLKNIYVHPFVKLFIYKYDLQGRKLDSLAIPKRCRNLFSFRVINGLDSVLLLVNRAVGSHMVIYDSTVWLSNRARKFEALQIDDPVLKLADNLMAKGWNSIYNYTTNEGERFGTDSIVYSCIQKFSVPDTIKKVPMLIGINLKRKNVETFGPFRQAPPAFYKILNKIDGYYWLGHDKTKVNHFFDESFKNDIVVTDNTFAIIDSIYLKSKLYPNFNLDTAAAKYRKDKLDSDPTQIAWGSIVLLNDTILERRYFPPKVNSLNQKMGAIRYNLRTHRSDEFIYRGPATSYSYAYETDSTAYFWNQQLSDEKVLVWSKIRFTNRPINVDKISVEKLKGYDSYLEAQCTVPNARKVIIMHLSLTCPPCVKGFVDSLNTTIPSNVQVILIDNTPKALANHIAEYKIKLQGQNTVVDSLGKWETYFMPNFNPYIINLDSTGQIANAKNLTAEEMFGFSYKE